MTTNYHTAISTGAAANASTFNTPLGQLDDEIGDVYDDIAVVVSDLDDVEQEIYDARNGQSTLEDEIDRIDARVSTIIAASGTSDTEVVDSRNGYTVLNDRLDEINLTSSVLYVDLGFTGLASANRYDTISGAVAACSGGETILISPGIYTEDVQLADDNLTIIGSGMPAYDSGTGRLVGGTIIRGHLDCNEKVGINIRSLGIDQVGTATTNCITVCGSATAVNMYSTFRDIAILGDGSDSTGHGIENNGGFYITFDNIDIRYCINGMALLGSYINVNNVRTYGCGGGTSIIVKSKSSSPNAEHVNINNIVVDGATTTTYTRGGPIVVQSADAAKYTRYINISNVTAVNCVNGVIQLTRLAAAGTVSDVTISNVRSEQNRDLAGVGDFWIKTGDRITLTDCASIDRVGGYGFVVDPADNVGEVYAYNCTGDASGSGDYDGIFEHIDTNGVANNGIRLVEGGQYRTSRLTGAWSAGVSVTGASVPVASLSYDGTSTNDYGGIVVIWARSSTTSAGNSATYVYLIMKGEYSGGTAVASEIAKGGLTGGGGASFPSFTFTVDAANNHLEASVVGSTTGTFYFSFATFGSIYVSAL